MSTKPHIHTVVSEPFAENTYVVWLPDRTDALVIDPGLEPELIVDFLRQESRSVAAILCTHGHGDHIGGNAALKAAFPDAPLLIGVKDAPMLSDAWANLSAPFGMSVLSPPADRLLQEGDVVEGGGIRLDVLDVPGHSPGHVVFVLRGAPTIVFGGDVLFRDGVGRTDFPGGDADTLFSGIRSKLFTFADDTIVYPGHGPVTTIGHERVHNPFVNDL